MRYFYTAVNANLFCWPIAPSFIFIHWVWQSNISHLIIPFDSKGGKVLSNNSQSYTNSKLHIGGTFIHVSQAHTNHSSKGGRLYVASPFCVYLNCKNTNAF